MVGWEEIHKSVIFRKPSKASISRRKELATLNAAERSGEIMTENSPLDWAGYSQW